MSNDIEINNIIDEFKIKCFKSILDLPDKPPINYKRFKLELDFIAELNKSKSIRIEMNTLIKEHEYYKVLVDPSENKIIISIDDSKIITLDKDIKDLKLSDYIEGTPCSTSKFDYKEDGTHISSHIEYDKYGKNPIIVHRHINSGFDSKYWYTPITDIRYIERKGIYMTYRNDEELFPIKPIYLNF